MLLKIIQFIYERAEKPEAVNSPQFNFQQVPIARVLKLKI